MRYGNNDLGSKSSERSATISAIISVIALGGDRKGCRKGRRRPIFCAIMLESSREPPVPSHLLTDAFAPGARDATPRHSPSLTAAGPNPSGHAALAAAQALARKAAAPATLRAYKADWQRYAGWCARGLRRGAGRAGHRRRLSRQPRRQPRPHHHHPPPVVRARQDAPFQRPALEPGASGHPGPVAGPVRAPMPAGAESRGAHLADVAPVSRHLRPQRPWPARPRAAAVRLCRSVAPLRTGGAAGRGCRHRRWRAARRIVRGKTDPTGQGAELGLPRGRHVEDLPAACLRGMAGGRQAPGRSAVPPHQHRRPGSATPPCIPTRSAASGRPPLPGRRASYR